MTEYRGFKIVGDGTYGNKLIKTIGQGSLPDVLKGSFTRPSFAHVAIDRYILEKEAEANKPPRVQKVKLHPKGIDNGNSQSD